MRIANALQDTYIKSIINLFTIDYLFKKMIASESQKAVTSVAAFLLYINKLCLKWLKIRGMYVF